MPTAVMAIETYYTAPQAIEFGWVSGYTSEQDNPDADSQDAESLAKMQAQNRAWLANQDAARLAGGGHGD